MYREDQRKGTETKGLRYSSRVRGKLIEVKYPWEQKEYIYLPIQKHTNRVIVLNTFPSPPTIGDAVITSLKGVEVGIRTADCVPVILVGHEWVGAVHVGWKGLASGVLEKTIDRLSAYEDVSRLFAFIGPGAKACCYEVGEEFKNIFPGYLYERENSLFMDMQEAVMKELKSIGVRNFGLLELCTVCSEQLPSHRRDKTQERLLTSVRIL